MSYNAYPTLYGQTTPGATCTAYVVYNDNRTPRSFDGSAETADGAGTVSWTWHEETVSSGGTGTVSCTLGNQSGSASAQFTVSG